ncbi:hypothetical protein M8C13_18910 [Crossiella sp. SN42]|uniref:hypothetical protein n=1 Tax=Crossiella sp. SN42 TaxID=2944808 RepID=UPI00207C99A1|nr:hypothetical protein [Crossiella sp. SN42]MCO1577828.1 hypothetical protein [Crossiella sp. SN42]
MGNAVERECQETSEQFGLIGELEGIAEDADPQTADRLRALVRKQVACLAPVRVSVTAKLLDVTTPTVRAWLDRGVLAEAEGDASTRRVDPRSLHAVMGLVRELRAAGAKPGNLLDQLWDRLADQALLDRSDLRESLARVRRGDLVEL